MSIPPPRYKNFLIVNLHSAQNLGDEAIMHETLRRLRQVYPAACITLAANDPESWKKFDFVEVIPSLTTWALSLHDRHWRLRLVHIPLDMIRLIFAILFYRWWERKYLFGSEEQRKLLSAYYASDMVLSCGGGNFSAYRRLSPFFLWGLLALWLAACLGKKLIMLPQSIGPIKGRLQTDLARRVFLRTDLIMTREMLTSAFLVKELRLSKPTVFIPDLAFGLPHVPAKLPLSIPRAENHLKIGLTLMDRGAQTRSFSSQQKYEDALHTLVKKLLDHKNGLCIYLFSQCYGPGMDHDDRLIVRRMNERLQDYAGRVFLVREFRDALEIKAAYNCMDCVIGTRLHTGIFALSESVPVVLIGYQPKTFGIMRSLGLEQYCVDIETVDEDALYIKVLELLENRQNFRELTRPLLVQIQNQLEVWPHYLEMA